jgi:hypothetical protein
VDNHRVARKGDAAVEQALDELRAALKGPDPKAAIRTALANGKARVVAFAADAARERQLDGLDDELAATFQRFRRDPAPAKADPSCRAKLALLEALDFASYSDAAPFLDATTVTQLEATWGPPEDTAGPVRARGMLALSRLGDRDLGMAAGRLLADPLSLVRQAAAEAIASTCDRALAGLLQLRWSLGDEDPLVLVACGAGLVAAAPELALPGLRAALGTDRREIAAVVLGQSNRDDALAVLLEAIDYEGSASLRPPTGKAVGAPAADLALADDRAPILRALGLHRTEGALAAALEIIKTGGASDAAAAIAGLAARRFDPKVLERVRRAAADRDERVVKDALAAYGGAG